MKKLNFVKSFLFAVVAAAGFSSCSDDDGSSGSQENLLEVAQSNGLTTFVEAARIAGIDDILEGSNKRTVFAPNNLAMATFLSVNGYADFNDVPQNELRELLLNHIITGDRSTANMDSGYFKTMAHGPASTSNAIDMFIEVASDITINGDAKISTPNLDASNGRLHVVNRVIAMPTVYSFIKADPNLLTFYSGINQDVDLVDPLSQPGMFTVFSPNESAFTALNTELDYDAITDYPAADLKKILSYQVVPNLNKLYPTVSNGDVFPTRLAGQNLTASVSGGGKMIVDVNNRTSTFTDNRDIQAANGVIHVMPKVLLPNL